MSWTVELPSCCHPSLPPLVLVALTARKFARVLSMSVELLPLASVERAGFSGVSPSSSSLSA